MKRSLIVTWIMALGSLMGCGSAEVEVDEGILETLDSPPPDGTLFSRDQVDAMLKEAPLPQATLTTCQPTKTCTNLGYTSCGSWSSVTSCGSLSACNALSSLCKICEPGPNGKPICEPIGTQFQGHDRYRVCFNAAAESCTEYEYTSTKLCGCSGPP